MAAAALGGEAVAAGDGLPVAAPVAVAEGHAARSEAISVRTAAKRTTSRPRARTCAGSANPTATGTAASTARIDSFYSRAGFPIQPRPHSTFYIFARFRFFHALH